MRNGNYKALWRALLKLKDRVYAGNFTDEVILPGEIKIRTRKTGSHYFLKDHEIERGPLSLDRDTERFLDLYLPFCFVHLQSDLRKYAWSTAHFAQTLDGKIATHVGHSQWIGNRENLVHAHRMRAISDAVIIGAGTLERDKPQLTVRHVPGKTPARVVIGSGDYDFSCMFDDEAPIYHISTQAPNDKRIKQIDIPTEDFDDIDCKMILVRLYEMGIKTVYIEGGSYTSSKFLEEKFLDRVQLHIAPLIVGSGISNFTLPLKDHLDQSIQFSHYEYYHMGSEIMFQGEVKH